MSTEIPKDLHYSKTHEWVRLEEEGIYAVGVTDYAQCQLGDIVYVELPDVGAKVHAGDEVVVLESVKTAADVYAPLSGEIIEVNEILANDPSRVNTEPYGDGWLIRIKIRDEEEISDLMDADAYEEELSED
jgi:glycine cleavage system H protein